MVKLELQTLIVDSSGITRDISSFLVDRSFFSPTASANIPRAVFYLDDNRTYTPIYGDEVYTYIKTVDSSTWDKRYGGFITVNADEKGQFKNQFSSSGFKQKAFDTDFTGRFRADSGNGNAVTIFKAIIDEKFPDWTYDDDSIPSTTVEYTAKAYDGENCGNLLNTIATALDRDWETSHQ